MREGLKICMHALATLMALPAIVSYLVRKAIIGPDRALEGSTQALAWLPGLAGVYIRRAFLRSAIAQCERTASVHFGTLLSQAGTRLESNVYVGPCCHLGLVHVGRDVLIASGVQIPSGRATHGVERTDIPIREQEGQRTLIRIGEGSWIGSGAIVMADIGRHVIVGAGAVVTKPVTDFAIVVGVPARVVGHRNQPAPL